MIRVLVGELQVKRAIAAWSRKAVVTLKFLSQRELKEKKNINFSANAINGISSIHRGNTCID